MNEIKIGMSSVDPELLLMAVLVFLYAIADPFFGPRALACLAAAGVVALLLGRRRTRTLSIDLRRSEGLEERPLGPR